MFYSVAAIRHKKCNIHVDKTGVQRGTRKPSGAPPHTRTHTRKHKHAHTHAHADQITSSVDSKLFYVKTFLLNVLYCGGSVHLTTRAFFVSAPQTSTMKTLRLQSGEDTSHAAIKGWGC